MMNIFIIFLDFFSFLIKIYFKKNKIMYFFNKKNEKKDVYVLLWEIKDLNGKKIKIKDQSVTNK